MRLNKAHPLKTSELLGDWIAPQFAFSRTPGQGRSACEGMRSCLPRVPEGSRLLLRVPQDVDAILATSPYFIRIERRTKWDKYRKVEKIDDTLGVLP